MSNSVAESVFERLKAKSIATKSELGVRDEGAQRRKFIQTIPSHKYEEKSVDKFIIPIEIALDFNPYTGKEDDEYNRNDKFRLTYSATTTALVLKRLAAENEGTRQAFLSRAGLTEWQGLDKLDEITKFDWNIFRQYRVPRTFTDSVAMIDSKDITGFDNPVGYSVKVARDEYGRVVGTMPIFLQIQRFFGDMNSQEAKHIKELRESKDANWKANCRSKHSVLENYNIVAMEEKLFKKEVLSAIYNQGLVSEERPVNFHVAYKFKMNTSTSLIEGFEKIKSLSVEDLDKSLVLLKKSKELNELFDKFRPGKPFSRNDIHFDFFEVDFFGPDDVGTNDEKVKRMLVAQKTKANVPLVGLEKVKQENDDPDYPSGYNEEFYASFCAQIIKKQDDMESVEKRFKASSKARPLTEEVEGILVEELRRRNYLLNKPEFLTSEVLLRNKDILTLVHGDEGVAFFAALEVGLEEAKSGGEINEGQKSEDLSGVDLTDESDDVMVEGADKSVEVEAAELEI